MTDKTFQFAQPLENTLNNAKYNNNEPLIYSEGGVFRFLMISNWEDVPLLTKTAITTAMTEANYQAID